MGSQVGEQRSSVKELAYCSKLTVYTCGSRIITIPLARPAISNITGPVTFMSGQSSTAILSCTVSGLPIEDVMVNWTFNMETLRTSDKYSMAVAAISNHQLTINADQQADNVHLLYYPHWPENGNHCYYV